MDDYLFDLRGYLILEHAIEPELVDSLNAEFDAFPDISPQGWWGNVQRIDHDPAGRNLALDIQNIVEAGEPFEQLIDHPSWVGYAHRFAGEAESYVEGLYIDECFATVRRVGGYSPPHSGWLPGRDARSVPVQGRRVQVRAGECVDGAHRHRAGGRCDRGGSGEPQVEFRASAIRAVRQ